MTVLLGNGDGTFTFKSSPAVGDAPYWVAVGDFNGDGILGPGRSELRRLQLSQLHHRYGERAARQRRRDIHHKSTLTVGTAPEFVAVGDFNGDGIPDLAVTNGATIRSPCCWATETEHLRRSLRSASEQPRALWWPISMGTASSTWR